MDQHSPDQERELPNGTSQDTSLEPHGRRPFTQEHAHSHSFLESDSTILHLYTCSAHDRMPQQK